MFTCALFPLGLAEALRVHGLAAIACTGFLMLKLAIRPPRNHLSLPVSDSRRHNLLCVICLADLRLLGVIIRTLPVPILLLVRVVRI